MTCLICLGHKNKYYNLCDICNNCLVCTDCYTSNELALHTNCFNCRHTFTRINRRTNCNDVLYFLHYFRHVFIYVISMVFLPNLNTIMFFPEKKYLEKHTILFQNIEIYLFFLNYMNLVIFPYIFNFFYNTTHIFFWIICMTNCIFTLAFPTLNKDDQSYLHLFYNIVYIYAGCLCSFLVFTYSELYISYSNYIKNFINNIRIIKSKIKIHNHYIRRRPIRVAPLQEHQL